jgi:hypothetical protein
MLKEDLLIRALPCMHIAFVGDSVVRHLYLALVRALANPEVPHPEPLAKHADMHFTARRGFRASFLWRPYAANVTAAFSKWAEAGAAPDAVVTGVGLWHALHVSNVSEYERHLRALQGAWLEVQRRLVRPQPLLLLSHPHRGTFVAFVIS